MECSSSDDPVSLADDWPQELEKLRPLLKEMFRGKTRNRSDPVLCPWTLRGCCYVADKMGASWDGIARCFALPLNPGNQSGMLNGSAPCSGHQSGFGGLMQHAASKRREEMTEDQVEQLWGDHGEEPDLASARLHRLLHEVLTEAGHEELRQEQTSSGPNKRR